MPMKCFLILLLLLLPAAPAFSQSCTFSNTGLDFGNLTLTNASQPTTSGTFTASCTGTANQSIRICPNIGAGTGGTTSNGSVRYLQQGPSLLAYTIYSGSNPNNVWGSYLWGYSPVPPAIAVNLDGSGTGSTSLAINALIYANQGGTGTGTFTSNFSGNDAKVDYGYAASFPCSSVMSSRATSVPFVVRATNRSSCTVSTTPLEFGSRSALTSVIDTTNTISLNCTSGTAYSVSLNNGNSGGTGPAARLMAGTGTTDKVTYGIYLDAARSQAWGNGTIGGVASGTGTGANQNFIGYGRIPVQTTPSITDYNDTVVVTVTY